MENRQQLIVLMTRIERWAIDNNLTPNAQFGSTADCIFICQNYRTNNVCTLVLLIL